MGQSKESVYIPFLFFCICSFEEMSDERSFRLTPLQTGSTERAQMVLIDTLYARFGLHIHNVYDQHKIITYNKVID